MAESIQFSGEMREPYLGLALDFKKLRMEIRTFCFNTRFKCFFICEYAVITGCPCTRNDWAESCPRLSFAKSVHHLWFKILNLNCWLEHRYHNPGVGGSSPPPATNKNGADVRHRIHRRCESRVSISFVLSQKTFLVFFDVAHSL